VAEKSEIYFDGFVAITGGMDSGKSPQILPNDTLAMLVNGTVRGAFIGTRPRFRKIELTFASQAIQTAFESGLFQGAAHYRPDDINRMQDHRLHWRKTICSCARCDIGNRHRHGHHNRSILSHEPNRVDVSG
jgi:hypothetical protein